MDNQATNSWLWPALLTAAIAAVGYVAKLLLESIQKVRADRRARRSNLLELYSLLRAGFTAFKVQNENRNKLMDIIRSKYQQEVTGKIGFEEKMEAVYTILNPAEKELHTLIRAITMHTIYPVNEAMLKWLKSDTYYKSSKHNDGNLSKLSQSLMALEAHLYLWHAKYVIWMPDTPAHSLVYLADEKRHGVVFPKGIEVLIEKVLKLRALPTPETGDL
jgi:hypothetical protein